MDIPVNKQQWDNLTDDEKAYIINGLREVGALKAGYRIVPDASAQPFADGHGDFDKMWDPIGDICRAACDTTSAVGAAWCYANTAGPALPVCLAAVAEARKECRKRC